MTSANVQDGDHMKYFQPILIMIVRFLLDMMTRQIRDDHLMQGQFIPLQYFGGKSAKKEAAE